MDKSGFTMVELILAVTILAVVTSVAYFTFDAGVRAWRSGTQMADSLSHADYVLEQIVMGLRSAYYPDGKDANGNYGFVLTDDGSEGESARDVISWVKLGSALVGSDNSFAGIPHRVEISVRDPDSSSGVDGSGFAVRAWRIDAQPEDFDPEEDVEPFFLTSRVLGMNCRTLSLEQEEDDDELTWDDEWEDTNRVPFAVEITLFLEPSREGDDPIEVQRIAEIPLAPLSWADKGIKSPIAWDSKAKGAGSSTSGSSSSDSGAKSRSSGGSQSGGSQSGGSKSGGSQSGGFQSGGSQSGGSHFGGSQSGRSQSGGSQSGSGNRRRSGVEPVKSGDK